MYTLTESQTTVAACGVPEVSSCLPSAQSVLAGSEGLITMASQMWCSAAAVLVVLMVSVHQAQAGYFADGAWGQAHATYYGGVDASGTQG